MKNNIQSNRISGTVVGMFQRTKANPLTCLQAPFNYDGGSFRDHDEDIRGNSRDASMADLLGIESTRFKKGFRISKRP